MKLSINIPLTKVAIKVIPTEPLMNPTSPITGSLCNNPLTPREDMMRTAPALPAANTAFFLACSAFTEKTIAIYSLLESVYIPSCSMMNRPPKVAPNPSAPEVMISEPPV